MAASTTLVPRCHRNAARRGCRRRCWRRWGTRLGRGEGPEVSPLLRAEDGRVGEATRDAAPVEDDRDSPTTSGWFASRARASRRRRCSASWSSGAWWAALPYEHLARDARHQLPRAPPERAHRHRAEGVADLPEVFVVTGEDEGPIGEWLRCGRGDQAQRWRPRRDARSRRRRPRRRRSWPRLPDEGGASPRPRGGGGRGGADGGKR